MPDITEIRNSLRAARQSLQENFQLKPRPQPLLRAHTKIVDEHLREVWQLLDMPPGLALVAVGGYGRAELFPHSDIDLLVLLPGPPDDALQQCLQELVSAFWDIGLEAGHSVRTVDECLAECADVTVQTNLLEARFITGSEKLFDDMRAALDKRMDRRAFYHAKFAEQEQRHARFFDTDFNLEPNLKESPGGLRDLQSVMWIARASGFGGSLRELAAAGLITEQEARRFTGIQSFLQALRIRLHYLSKRHEDRLLFDYQTELASQMGIAATATRRASELMMQRYYLAKRAVLMLNTVLMQNLRAHLFPEETEVTPINERFVARGDRLEARDEMLFERDPSTILESFLLMEQHPELHGFSAATTRAMWRARFRVDAAFRRERRNRELFMQIMRQPQGVTHVLRRMNRHGILRRYIPAFDRIVGQMQHDLIHVYTVDEHILMAVHNLRCFTLEKHAHEFPLCSSLMKDFARPEVLYIAGLFHDIAKGRGGDHSIKGKPDAARFCKQHELMREDAHLVEWLVEHHLDFSRTAQTKDLSDQDTIAAFAAMFPNDRYLVALYLLTVADIRATSPRIWNAWKGKLLEDLFHLTRRFMAGGKVADLAGEVRAQAREQLTMRAIAPEVYEFMWAQLDPEYFMQHEPHEIAWHTRHLAHRVNTPSPIVKARLSPIGEGIQVMVYCSDRPFLFARICNFFARLRYNIVEARIHTTTHGYALDSFMVMDADGDRTEYRDVMSYIEHELAQDIERNEALTAPPAGRINRQLKHFPIKPEVRISEDEKRRHVLFVVAGDRPGLLARIAQILACRRIELRNAKINTLGARAEDTFWIDGAELDNPLAVAELREEILQQVA